MGGPSEGYDGRTATRQSAPPAARWTEEAPFATVLETSSRELKGADILREAVLEPGIAIPIVPARNLAETRTFYEGLGFRATGWWPRQFGGYAILVRGDLTMHFFAYDDLSPSESYAQCYWRVKDVDALYAECAAANLPKSGAPRLEAVEDKPWGTREFAIVDPNGTLIRVGQERESTNADRS
jgi:catechol 2,3-dioxygenase-like lactoylglutathione lyase family enzyme